MPMPLGAVGITSFTQTASGPLKYEVSVALRRASMLSCCFPEVALAKPGSSNTTHESLAISLKLIETSGLSVFTRISVPSEAMEPDDLVSLKKAGLSDSMIAAMLRAHRRPKNKGCFEGPKAGS